jgi:hypothetical protein
MSDIRIPLGREIFDSSWKSPKLRFFFLEKSEIWIPFITLFPVLFYLI